jgi:hypothetical protein
MDQYDNPTGQFAEFRKFIDQPENQELIGLLADAFSTEVFTYFGANWADFSDLANRVSAAQQYGPMLMQATGQGEGKSPGVLQARAILNVLSANIGRIQVPDIVCGFKLNDTKRAAGQIKRLEALLDALAQKQLPQLQGRVKRAEVAGQSFLTVTLDGDLVPWEQIPFDDAAEQPGQYEALVKKLKGLKITISLGVRDDFLMLGFGASTATVAKLGSKGPRLLDRPEMKPVAAALGKRLTSVGYSSRSLRSRAEMGKAYLEEMAALTKANLAKSNLPEDRRKALEKDVDSLVADLRTLTTEPGAEVSFGYLTERGAESLTYDYGEFPTRDGSKPLTLLDHVGGSPILALVGRSKGTLERYRMLSKWVKKGYGHFDALAREKMGEQEKQQYEKWTEALLPLLRRVDEITATMLLPSLADGQTALVLDAKWTSKQWIKGLGATEKPMPMPELALVLGVSNADQLQKAMSEYRKVVNDAIAKMKELAPPGQFPDVKLPKPQARILAGDGDQKGGTLFSYPLPDDWGVDLQVLPTAGLSERVVALTLSHEHAERLLSRKPLKVDGGPLAKERPLAGAAYFDWPAFVDAVTPWVEFALQTAPLKIPGLEGEEGRQEVLKEARVLLDVFKVMRRFTSATYFEEGALVTHSETVFRDLPGKGE